MIWWRQDQALRLCRRHDLLEQPAGFVFLMVCHGYSFPTLPRLPATLLPTSSQKLGVFAAWVSSPRTLSAAFEDVPKSDWLAPMGAADAPRAAWLKPASPAMRFCCAAAR